MVIAFPCAILVAARTSGVSLEEALTGLGALVALCASILFSLQMQARELRLQRRELELTRGELQRQHEETAGMKRELEAQNRIAEMDILARDLEVFVRDWAHGRSDLEAALTASTATARMPRISEASTQRALDWRGQSVDARQTTGEAVPLAALISVARRDNLWRPSGSANPDPGMTLDRVPSALSLLLRLVDIRDESTTCPGSTVD